MTKRNEKIIHNEIDRILVRTTMKTCFEVFIGDDNHLMRLA
jgi:hypothetical protein